jgi:hypothetical protein
MADTTAATTAQNQEIEVRFNALIFSTISNFLIEVVKTNKINTLSELFDYIMARMQEHSGRLEKYNAGEDGEIKIETGEYEGK